MKTLLMVIGLMLSIPALGQPSLLEIAEDVRDQQGLEKLVAASFGGGKHYKVSGSLFHVVDLMPTSGILSTELFVFELIDGRLVLRAHVPSRPFTVMKAEMQGGMLVVSEKSQREGEWSIRFHMMPAGVAGRSPDASS